MPDGPKGAARRHRLVILICLAVATALAWVYLVRASRQMSATMDHDAAMAAMGMRASWETSDTWLTFQMWVVMMIGMMSASAAPVLLLFSATAASRRLRFASVSVIVFAAGYLTAWAGFSLAATLVQWGLHEAALLSPTMRVSSAYVGGGILGAAGLYQLTPLKAACLTHCRSPLGFLMSRWRDGVSGAFRMGAHHGTYCLGCCWALMAVLFALGVMNLVWVALLGGVVLIEKIGPGGARIAQVSGVVLLIAGAALILVR